jgi:hypothetical protein
VVLVPGVLALISGVTGAGIVSWRLMWVVPGPVLVGLLAAIPIPVGARLRGPARRSPGAMRWLALAPALTLCALVLVNGRVVWSHANADARITSHPAWKYDPLSLSLARKALRADHRAGYLLSTQRVMSAIPLITTKVRAVDGRSYYLHLLPAGPQFIADRDLLTRMAGALEPMPAEAAVRAALARVGVGYACVWKANTGALRLLADAGFTPDMHVGGFECLRSGRPRVLTTSAQRVTPRGAGPPSHARGLSIASGQRGGHLRSG